MCSQFISAMTQYHHYGFNTAGSQVSQARVDNRSVTEGKQRLKRAHAPRLSGGENDCGDFIPLRSVVVGFSHYTGIIAINNAKT